mmetsp:Transcript_39849/g.113060  ORF Transcript_39849/g.113060 Transcript_39849/m.113060 type:complete len:320 (-) Transcript_39849:689-1648(-)
MANAAGVEIWQADGARCDLTDATVARRGAHQSLDSAPVLHQPAVHRLWVSCLLLSLSLLCLHLGASNSPFRLLHLLSNPFTDGHPVSVNEGVSAATIGLALAVASRGWWIRLEGRHREHCCAVREVSWRHQHDLARLARLCGTKLGALIQHVDVHGLDLAGHVFVLRLPHYLQLLLALLDLPQEEAGFLGPRQHVPSGAGRRLTPVICTPCRACRRGTHGLEVGNLKRVALLHRCELFGMAAIRRRRIPVPGMLHKCQRVEPLPWDTGAGSATLGLCCPGLHAWAQQGSEEGRLVLPQECIDVTIAAAGASRAVVGAVL